jgi:hypothetical protein
MPINTIQLGPRPSGYLKNYDNCLKEARKFTSLKELRKKDGSLHASIHQHGFVERIVKEAPLARDHILNKEEQFERISNLAKERGGITLSDKYIGNHTKMDFECPQKHVWSATPRNIIRGSWCPECKIYFGEAYCRAMLEAIFGKPFPTKYPKWLKGLELDGYNEELKLAFEYQGRQHYKAIKSWGGQKQLKTLQDNDCKKVELCNENGINLIVIPTFGPKLDKSDLEALIFNRLGEFGISLDVKRPIEIDLKKVYRSEHDDRLKELKDIVESKGGVLEDTVYLGTQYHKYSIDCKRGHKLKIDGNHLKGGNWCNKCNLIDRRMGRL